MITLSDGTRVNIVMEGKYRRREKVVPNTIVVDNQEVPLAWAEGMLTVEVNGKRYSGERIVVLAPSKQA